MSKEQIQLAKQLLDSLKEQIGGTICVHYHEMIEKSEYYRLIISLEKIVEDNQWALQ
jgi:hypothetical protein